MTVAGPTGADLKALMLPLDRLPAVLAVPTVRVPAEGGVRLSAAVRPPGSKSLTNRALLLAALASGESVIRGALRGADDAERMTTALRALGAGISDGPEGEIRVRGVAGRWRVPPEGVALEVGNAGTAARFLAAAAVLSPGVVTIDGDARMRERPIGQLGEVLGRLGCAVDYPGRAGCPPLRITPPAGGPRAAGPIEIGTTQSSQFISALLLVAPWIPGGVTLRILGEVTSAAYVSMTLGLLARFGADVRSSDDLRVIRVGGGGGLPPLDYDTEPDASGATYWWAAGALLPGANVRVTGLGHDSLQGDAQFPELLARMGAKVTRRDGAAKSLGVEGPATLRPILADMSDMPDAAMTLAALACFAEGTSILRGLRTLRAKESDRIEAMKRELGKLGVRVENPVQGDPDAITITPPAGGLEGAEPVEFDTYNDHRMAMSLSLIGLRRPNVRVKDPRCVAKTYPAFWADMASLLR